MLSAQFETKEKEAKSLKRDKPNVFPLTLQQLSDAFEEYKKSHGVGTDLRASHADFFRCAGITVSDVKTFMQSDSSVGRSYKPLADKLKNIDTWIKAEYDIDPRYNGPGTGKAIFLQKQDFGFGSAYSDKVEQQTSGDMRINVVFGGAKDSFK